MATFMLKFAPPCVTAAESSQVVWIQVMMWTKGFVWMFYFFCLIRNISRLFHLRLSSLRYSGRMWQWACSERWSLPWRCTAPARRAAVRTTAPPTASPKTTATRLASAARCCRGCRSEAFPPCSPSTSCASWWVCTHTHTRTHTHTHTHTRTTGNFMVRIRLWSNHRL